MPNSARLGGCEMADRKAYGSFAAMSFETIRRAEAMQAASMANLQDVYAAEPKAVDLSKPDFDVLLAHLERLTDNPEAEEAWNRSLSEQLLPLLEQAFAPPQEGGEANAPS